MALVQPTYRPRDAEHTALHAVIREHLENFLRAAADHGEGAGLPQFIERVKAACANARAIPPVRAGNTEL